MSTNTNPRAINDERDSESIDEADKLLNHLFETAYDDQIKLVEKLFLDDSSKDATKTSKLKKKRNRIRIKLGESSQKTDASRETNALTTKETSPKHKDQNKDNTNITHRSRVYRFNEDLVSNKDVTDMKDSPMKYIPPVSKRERMALNKVDGQNEEELRSAMLLSWYNAGYQTGFYEAMRRYKKSEDNEIF